MAPSVYKTGEYTTRFEYFTSIPAAGLLLRAFDQRRIALSIFFNPVGLPLTNVAWVGGVGKGIPIKVRSTDSDTTPVYTFRRWEMGDIVCGDVICATSLGTGSLVVTELLYDKA